MKKLITMTIMVLAVALAVAQAPEKFTYQAVVRNASNQLVTNAQVGVRVNILQGSATGNGVYSESHLTITNANGLLTVSIGGGSVLHGSFVGIDWAEGPYFLKTDIDPNGGNDYTITSVQQLLSVPYALYAKDAGNGFSGDYNDLTNLPQIPQIPTDVSAFNNDAGYLTDYTETDPQYNAWDKDYNDLTNKPTLFSGNYNDLTNKPMIPTVPTNVSAFTNDAGYLTEYTEQQVLSISHDTLFLTGGSFVKLPAGFDGDYNSLTNKPAIPTVPTNVSAFNNDAGYLTNYTETDPQFNAWDKDYNDLINKPAIPAVPTNVSAFNNDASYITMDSVPAIPTNVSAFTNDAGYLTNYTETDPQFNAWDKNYNDLTNKPVLFSGNYNDLTNKPAIPAVPTNVSAFTNDVGYITVANVQEAADIPTNVSAFNNDAGYITSEDIPEIPTVPTNVSAFTNDAGYLTSYTETDPEFNAWDKNYNDLTNKPTLFSGNYNDLTNKPTLFDGNYNSLINKPNLATVATTGNYNDLVSKPTLFSGNYNDLTNKPTIPTVNNATLTIQRNGSNVGTFTANQNTNQTVNITVPTTTSQLTNNSGYITISDVPVQVNADWNATNGAAQILNKPNIPTNVSQLNNDAGYITAAQCGDVDICAMANQLAQLQQQMSQMQARLDSLEGNTTFTCGTSTVTDHEGNVYHTVKIGDQCWTKENLRTTTSPSTGTYLIPAANANYTFTGKQACWINNDSATYAPMNYGLLYNWNAAVDTFNTTYGETSVNTISSNAVSVTFTGHRRGICPAGWHLPSDAEWTTLTDYVSSQSEFQCGGNSNYIAKALASTEGWGTYTNNCVVGNDPSTNNATGFSAVPAGYCDGSSFSDAGGRACFWSSTQYNSRSAYVRDLFYANADVVRYNHDKDYGRSVRCLRDENGGTAQEQPTATTSTATDLTQTSATLNGTISTPDNVTITAQGFEWKTTEGGTYAQVNAAGETMTYSLTGLAANTSYTYRAFVTTANGTSYGEEVTFTTLCGNVQLSIQATKTSICPGVESVTLTASGAETYTWSTNETGASITITAPGHYTVVGQDANGCEGFTDIYIYEEVCALVPQVATLEPTHDPELYYHYLSGQIVSDNGSAVTECGFCISDGDQEPTYPNSAMSVQNWTGNTFNKDLHVSDFTEGVTYYVRAYARNSAGTGYGETVTIKWPKHPIVNLSDNDITNVTDNSAAATASVELRNCTGIVAAGFCWREIENNVYPTLEDSHTVEAGSTSDYSFSSAITGLTQGIEYIVRAYVTTDENLTVYSGSSYFTTKCGAPTFELSACGDDCVEVTYDLTNTGAMDGIGAYIQYKEAAASVNSWYEEYAFSSPYYISYFLPNTEYEIRVGSHCDYESVSWSESKYFTVPYGSSAPTPAVTSAIPCTITSGHPAQTAALGYTASGANHGLETVTSDGKINSVTDYDGNEYPVVQIGSQCWLAENMRCAHYSDGTSITKASVTQESSSTRYYYDPGQAANYGYLYNWPAAKGPSSVSANNQGICPTGWHVPSDGEWTQLEQYVSSQSNYRCSNNSNYIAKALASTTGWNSSTNQCAVGNTPASNNATGFGAVPAGNYNGSYNNFGNNANFWSATQNNSNNAYSRNLGYNYATVYSGLNNKNSGYSVRCLRDENGGTAQAPTVTTTSNITGITTTSADIVSEVTSDGGATVTVRGICWSMAHNPTLSDSYTTDGGGTGSFTSNLTGLTAGTTYFVRAYATNSMGTTYGNEVSFTTTVEVDTSHTPAGDAHTCPEAATVTDIDNNVYNTVKIGNQCWMKENLRTTRLPDGTFIPSAFDFTTESPCRLPVDGNPGYVATYGYLYNWNAIMNNGCASSTNPSSVQGICPTGWHVPSEAEWTQLFDYIKSQEEYVYGDTADHIAKAFASQTGWVASSTLGSVGNDPTTNNATGFTALPAGFYGKYTGVDTVENFHFGTIVSFGTTTRANNNIARVYSFGFQNYNKEIIRYDDGLNVYSSVRCLRGESAPSSSQADLVPDISTLSVLSVTSTSADVNGQLTNGDAADVTTCGLCVSTSHNPTVNDLCAFGNSRPSSFHSIFTGLTPNTTYYARAFAQNCNGIFYGNEISFTTLLCDDVSVTVYDTVAKDPSSILLYESFDNSELPSGWNIIDQDGDGFNWSVMDTIFNRHTGAGCISSASWDQTAGVLSPNNWLVTPDVTLPNSSPAYLSWYAVAQDTNYKNDHYEVRLTTAAGTSTYDFNHLLMDVSSNASQYTHYSVDLSAFAGQTVRIAFVHNNCSDEFRVNLDDISVYTGTMPVDYTENLYSTFGCDSTVHHRIVIPYSSSASSSPKSASSASYQPTSTDVVPVTRRSNERTDAHQTDTPRALGTPAVEITPVSPSERRTVGNALMKQSSR